MRFTRVFPAAGLLTILGLAVLAEEAPRYELVNGGFEVPSILSGAEPGTPPEAWFYFSSTPGESVAGITDRKTHSGRQAFFFKGQVAKDAFHGIAQRISIEPGARVQFMVYALNDAREPIAGQATGTVSLEWQDEEGKEISRIYGDSWGAGLSPIRWEAFRVEDAAPQGAVYCVAVVTFYSRDCEGRGISFVDDATVTIRQ